MMMYALPTPAIVLLLLGVFGASVVAQSPHDEADRLFDTGVLENYQKAGDLCAGFFRENPKNYDAAWRASRAYREFAQKSKEQDVADWQSICKEYGKLGMEFGEKAIALKPDAIEGHFWYGCSVGNYSDGVSIVTALREGLKNKTQLGLEMAYKIDKTYKEGGPIKALGRFWFVLPWPLADKDQALKFLREHEKLYPEDEEGQVFLAEVLIEGNEISEAKKLLAKAAKSSRTYYANWAKRLLAEL